MSAAAVLRLLTDVDLLLATILVVNNLVNICIVILTANIIDSLFTFLRFEFLFKTVLVTFLLLLFGEILPKVLAQTIPVRFASMVARPLVLLRWIFYPLSYILVRTSSRISEKAAHRSEISLDEHDPEHEPRGARDAVGDRQLRQYRGAGDHETPRGHHGARCYGRLRNGQEDDHRIGILAHPGLRGGYRQHPWHALRQGPAALHQQRQRFRLAAAGPQTLLRARAQEDQRPAGRFPVEQGPHGHRCR